MPKPPSEKPAPTGAREKGRGSNRPRPRLPTLVGVAPGDLPEEGEKKRGSTRPRPRLPTLVGVAPAAPIIGKRLERPHSAPPAEWPKRAVVGDLRRFGRVPVEQPLLFGPKDEDGLTEGTAVDISLGGMFIATDAPPRFGTVIEIHMRLPGARGDLVLPATVRWMRSEGVGVQFGLLGAKATLAITEIVRLHEESKRRGR